MRMRWMAAALVLGLALAGCGESSSQDSAKGGSADTGTTTTSAGTADTSSGKKTSRSGETPVLAGREAVVAEAEKACRKSTRKRKRVDRLGATVAELSKLRVSGAEEARLDRYIITLETEVGLRRRLDLARRRKQSGQIEFLRSALARTRARADRLARGYGFEVCRVD